MVDSDVRDFHRARVYRITTIQAQDSGLLRNRQRTANRIGCGLVEAVLIVVDLRARLIQLAWTHAGRAFARFDERDLRGLALNICYAGVERVNVGRERQHDRTRARDRFLFPFALVECLDAVTIAEERAGLGRKQLDRTFLGSLV